MGEGRCSADQAFNILVDLRRESNREVSDVAQALVDQADTQAT
jgi:hypothetical protein